MKDTHVITHAKPTNARFIDLTGRTFHRLFVVGFSHVRQRGNSRTRTAYWNVRCQCGLEKVVCGLHLTHSLVKSCGCLRRHVSRTRGITHGEAGQPTVEYKAWQGMLSRCRRRTGPDASRYSRKGIRVCEEWAHSFEAFLNDMGRKPSPRHSLDRIDGCGNYEPSNCRWATRLQQSRNTSRNVRFEFHGLNLTAGEIGERVGLSGTLIRNRLNAGWSMSEATSTKPTPKHLCCAKKLERRRYHLKP